MPELPEVETVRRGLEQTVVGATIVRVRVLGRRTVRRQTPRAFQRFVRGRRITAVSRRGKFLFIALDEGVIVAHLRMSGQLLLVADAHVPVVPHTHAVFSLDDGRELRFVDPRTFGELFYAGRGGIELDSVLGGLGLDPLIDGVDAAELGALIARRRAAVKSLLLDQRLIAGIGNIYADEICFAARVRPDRPGGAVTKKELARLATAIADVLQEAVSSKGSSLRDSRYRDLFGEPGAFQDQHAVYGREGEPCRRCGRAIERQVIGGRSAHFCPHCQR